MLKQLFARKTDFSDADDAHGPALRRTLGPWGVTALGIGAVIGTGIFVVTGQAAAEHAGPAVLISFMLAAICSGFTALCYAEFATLIPISGSSYSYAYATLGEMVAWFIGWNMVLEYGISASAVAASWTGYFTSLLDNIGIHLPQALTEAPLAYTNGHLVSTGHLINLPAVAIVAALTWLCYVGIRESSGLNVLMVALKVGLIIVVVVAGYRYVDPANWHPFIPTAEGRRQIWLVRHHARRRHGVLRLYRFRGHLHGGPGVQEPATATCRSASLVSLGDLHRALSGHGCGLDRPDLLHTAWHQRAGGHGDRLPSRTRLAATGSSRLAR